jgi:hypothetical protein
LKKQLQEDEIFTPLKLGLILLFCQGRMQRKTLLFLKECGGNDIQQPSGMRKPGLKCWNEEIMSKQHKMFPLP